LARPVSLSSRIRSSTCACWLLAIADDGRVSVFLTASTGGAPSPVSKARPRVTGRATAAGGSLSALLKLLGVTRTQVGVQSAQFQGRVTSASRSSATIHVVSLITHDRPFGCRASSGSYRMTQRAGGWLIARADIHPRSCNR
jgi:hypothetical protein